MSDDIPSEDPTEFYFAETDLELTYFQQPGSAPRPLSAPRRPTRRPSGGAEAPVSASDVGDYLASAPPMFGHFLGPLAQLRASQENAQGLPNRSFITDIPLAGGAGQLAIADNNTAVPQDRTFFTYNHFENAIHLRQEPPPGFPIPPNEVDYPIDKYTVGFEKSFLDQLTSVQLQLPFTGQFAFGDQIASGQYGNLGVISKTAIFRRDYSSLVGGMGIDIPTGSKVIGNAFGSPFLVENRAVHLTPFVGLLALPTDESFVQTFVSVDVPTGGNRFVAASQIPGVPPQSALYNSQTLLLFDFMAGYWLMRNPGAGGITGIGVLGEIHYVSTLNDPDFITARAPGFTGATTYELTNIRGRQDIVNLTAGLNLLWNDRTQIRIAGAFPVNDSDNRTFDGELILQVNWLP